MAQEEGNVVQLEGIIHAFFREDGSLVIMTRKIDSNVWNASYGEEVTLSPEGVSNLRRLLGGEAVEQSRVPDLATACENHPLKLACGYKYCPDCGKPLGR